MTSVHALVTVQGESTLAAIEPDIDAIQVLEAHLTRILTARTAASDHKQTIHDLNDLNSRLRRILDELGIADARADSAQKTGSTRPLQSHEP
jgi:hypothetical protein